MSRRLAIGLAAAALLAASGASSAQDLPRPGRHALTVHRHRAPPSGFRGVASPLDIPLGDGVYLRTPFQVVAAGDRPVVVRIPHYQGPDGAYDSQADFVRSINGTPCGQACTARSLQRWGYAPAD